MNYFLKRNAKCEVTFIAFLSAQIEMLDHFSSRFQDVLSQVYFIIFDFIYIYIYIFGSFIIAKPIKSFSKL